MSYQGRFENQKQPPRRGKKMGTGLKVTLIVLVVLLALVAGLVIFAVSYYYRMMNKMNIVTLPKNTHSYTDVYDETQPQSKPTVPVQTAPVTEATTAPTETTRAPMSADDIVNILLVGQAAREGEESHLADTTILVSVNTYTGEVTLFSVLRDALIGSIQYTDTSGKTHYSGGVKFNTCYHNGFLWGGKDNGTVDAMAFTNAVLMNDYGIEVDYNVEVSFDSFIKIIDYMDGVSIELTQAEADYLNKDDVWVKRDIEAGEQRLYGMEALCYVRMRKAEGDSDSDIKRTARQRKLIEALLNKVRGMSLSELQGWVDILLPMITTTMTPNDVAGLLMKVIPVLPNLKVSSHTIPIENETLEGSRWGDTVDIYGDGFQHSVIRFDKNKNVKFIRAITEAEGVQ